MPSVRIENAPPTAAIEARLAPDPVRGAVIAGFALYLALLTLAWAAFNRWAPDRISLHLLGHGLTITQLRRHVLSHALEVILMFPALFVAELAITGWEGSSLRRLAVLRTPSSMSDLACWLLWEVKLMTVLIGIMSLGVGLVSGLWIHDQVAAITGWSPSAAGWPLWLQLPVLFLVFSFFDYWNHRLDHSALFWPLHRFHHAADDFCILSAVRVHPALFTSVITVVGPAVALGASPEAVFDLTFGTALLRYVIHSRIDSDFGWIGRYVVQSPTHHRLHHALDISTRPVGHFSLAPIWDHLFGTWAGQADQSLAIGVSDAPYRHGAWICPDLWRDYVAFWRGLWRGLIRAGAKVVIPSAPASTPS